jgi:hypothetical protein
MDASEFERDLGPWIDGELPADQAARMQAAADASPDLARRAALERRFHERIQTAMSSDADASKVAAMIERARARAAPTGRLRALPRSAWRAVAAVLVVAVAGMWWFCVPPFECSYMQALEAASHDAAAAPGAEADAMAERFRLPAKLDGAVAARPAAATRLDVFVRHLSGVRLDYVRPDGAAAFHVVACDSPDFHPSIRRRVERDGARWWTCDVGENCTWAFQSDDAQVVYAVTGPDDDDPKLYAAAKALRASLR